jgi:hypothetical protein
MAEVVQRRAIKNYLGYLSIWSGIMAVLQILRDPRNRPLFSPTDREIDSRGRYTHYVNRRLAIPCRLCNLKPLPDRDKCLSRPERKKEIALESGRS